jgi:hypothetical protein
MHDDASIAAFSTLCRCGDERFWLKLGLWFIFWCRRCDGRLPGGYPRWRVGRPT